MSKKTAQKAPVQDQIVDAIDGKIAYFNTKRECEMEERNAAHERGDMNAATLSTVRMQAILETIAALREIRGAMQVVG